MRLPEGQPQEGHIPCEPCGALLSVNMAPVSIDFPGEGRRLVSPKFDAPLICGECRRDPIKLKNTRKKMFEYVGEPRKQEGFDG
ncbi:hypothetical protein LCGC14_2459140 [marine sediment metagenome]|uniref:Uncharacterized protein n=1 Tax=marine sediment metagenome TaxID=412755 RepID=A0A0F9DQZ3_9ZZZZ